MKILFIGDIYGRSGREVLEKHLPTLKDKYNPDIIIVNGENAAQGRGITVKICEQFYTIGVDVITTGNHIWSQREIIPYINRDPKLLRPINLPDNVPGKGAYIFQTRSGQRIKVINAMCRIFMDPIENPFTHVEKEIEHDIIGQNIDAIFLDFHGEASSEKMAMGHYLDGRITALIGTHTHVPSADHHIMEHGTAFMSDAGMSGDYDSVIGARKDIPITKFVKNMPGERLIPANGEGTLCGALVTSTATGRAKSIYPIRIGGILSQSLPDIN